MSQKLNPNCSQMPDFNDSQTMDKEAEAGIIESVSMKNFMCHSHLEISFGPNVNFLIGNNGSGKSAVLTAIIIALGGKASATNRGNSLKNFIKTGKRSAEVTIKLRNRGPDAYKHDLYGDSIIIERKLLDSGGGGYKIKSSKSTLVASGKDELILILDHFNIQVDNPVAILTQEASKTFLHSRSPHDMYKFFMKATQLEQIKQDYVAAEESKRIAMDVMKEKRNALPELEKEVQVWRQRFEACESLENLRDKLQNLRKELAWSIISEAKRNLEPMTKELQTETLRTPKFDKKVEESEAKVKGLAQEYDQLQDEVKRLKNEADEMNPKRTEAKNTWAVQKNNLKKAQTDHRRICSDKDSVAKDRKQIELKIKELHQKDYSDYDEQRRVRLERIRVLEQQLNDQQGRAKTLEMDLGQFRGAVSTIGQELSQTRLEEKAVRSEIERLETQLRNYESAKTDKLSNYGHWMPTVIKKIDEAFRAGRFVKKPIGPIGANIAVKDRKWALAVEICLSRVLRGFCVDNYRDERVLESIFASACPPNVRKPVIFTSKFQNTLYSVPKNTTPYASVLDMLDISDPVIANFIIDQRGIEGILLIENGANARKLMRSNPHKGFNEAFTVEGDQLYSQPTFRMYSAEKSNAVLLTASFEEVIKQFQQDLSMQRNQLQQLRMKLNKGDEEMKKNSAEKQKIEAALSNLRHNISKTDREINELKEFEEPQPIDVTTLEAEAEEFNTKLKELDERIAVEMENVTKAKNDHDEAEENFHDIEQSINNIMESLDPIKSRFAEIGNELDTARQHQKHYIGKRKEHTARVQQLQHEHDTKMAEIESDRQKALQICEEITTRRTAQNLDNEVKQVEKQIAAEERTRGNRDEITLKYHEKRKLYEEVKREMDMIDNFLRKLGESLSVRNEWFQKARASLTLRTKLFFMNNLSARNFSGKLDVSHKEGTIEPVIYPKADADGASNKALSGGERSYSTACFILALWDGMHCPFRCLDEYDVFMDMVNRRITMDLMMKFAAEKKGSQFIFLSPLDMSGILKSSQPDVTIFELKAPERGQGTIEEEEED